MAKASIKERVIPKDKVQVNFNLSSEVVDRVKAMAAERGTSNSAIYNEAIAKFVDRYENKNGKIKSRKNS